MILLGGYYYYYDDEDDEDDDDDDDVYVPDHRRRRSTSDASSVERERKSKSEKHELRHYFEETTGHGFRYLVGQSSTGERWLWGMIILSGFIYSGYLLKSSIYEWEDNQGIPTIRYK